MPSQPTFSPALFVSRLPEGLWCTDDFDTEGQRVHRRETAVQKRYLNPNSRNYVWVMVFDIDRPDAALAWEDANLPPPSWTSQNPANGHAHIAYVLSAPISRSELSRRKPIRYLARIQAGMTKRLDADRTYSHRLTKNPINPTWKTFWGRHDPYSLDDLASFLDADLPLRLVRSEAVGVGRNVTLFDGLRSWGYRERLSFNDQDKWERACLIKAKILNREFHSPLADNEVRNTVRSVANWIWHHFDEAGFSKIQSRRGKKSGAKRKTASKAKKAEVLQTFETFV